MWKSVVTAPELTTKVVFPIPCKATIRLSMFRPYLPAVLFSFALLVYGLTRTHLNTFDAVAYANQMKLAEQTGKLRPLFHPHHLLFNALGCLWWRIAQSLGYDGGPLAMTQEMNAVLGAAGLTLFHAILRRLHPLGPLPLLITVGLAGSFGYWICATDGRVNMASLVLMIAAFHALLCFRETPTMHGAMTVGGLAGCALLFHESAGLFALIGLVGVFSSADKRKRTLSLAYCASWLVTVVLPYLLIGVFALHLTTLAAFHEWAGAYAERGWWWDFRILHNLRLDLFALRHAVFVEPPGRAGLAASPLHSLGLPALIFLGGLYLGSLAGLTAAALTIAFALPRLLRSAERPVTLLCLLWVGVYGLFFTVWCPGAFVFWVPTLIPLGILLMLSLAYLAPPPQFWGARKDHPAGQGLSILIRLPRIGAGGLLIAWIGFSTPLNFFSGILPYLKPTAGLSQWVARDIAGHTPPRALIVVAGVGDDAQCEVDVPYFAQRPVLSLHGVLAHSPTFPAAQAEVQRTLDKAFGAGRNIYVPEEIWANRRTYIALQRQCPEMTAPRLQSLFAAYHLQPSWRGPRGLVWKLTPPGRISVGGRRITRGNESHIRRPAARLGQIDICRGLAILAVIFIHVTGHFLTLLHPAKSHAPTSLTWDVLAVPNQCFQWAVPCFLMLSALVNAQSLARGGDVRNYARRRVHTALLPYLLWSGVYIALNVLFGHATLHFGAVARMLLTGTAHFHLYFFILVLEMYALLPLLLPLFQRRPPFWMVALGAVLIQLAVYGINREWYALHRSSLLTETILWDILPVALGLWLFSRASDIEGIIESRGRWIAAAVTIAALLVYEPLALQHLEFPKLHINTFAYQVGEWGYTAGMSVLVLALAFGLGRSALTRLLAYFGGESLGIYVMHPLAIIALDKMGATHHFGTGAGLVIYFAACLCLPLAAAWVWQRWKPVARRA